MKAIVIEDEQRAAKRLRRLLSELAPEIEILGEFDSILATKEYFSQRHRVDVIFSDIQLADGLSFELFEQIELNCPVIFTTAYDQYAIKAFKSNGIDYLLKPIQEEELAISIEKLRKMRQAPVLSDLMALASQLNKGREEYRTRFMVKVGSKIRTVLTSDIVSLYSENKGTYILTDDGRNHLIDYSLEQVEGMLDGKQFIRISRKYIVSLFGINEVSIHSNSRLKLELKGDADRDVVVARERVKEFKNWLEG